MEEVGGTLEEHWMDEHLGNIGETLEENWIDIEGNWRKIVGILKEFWRNIETLK